MRSRISARFRFRRWRGWGRRRWAALYRPQLGARAVGAGLLAGTIVWLYVLMPALFAAQPAWVTAGPFGWQWLAPDHLFGLHDWSRLGRAVVLNLAVNVAVMLLVARSRWGRAEFSAVSGGVESTELRALALRFLPGDRVATLFADSADRQDAKHSRSPPWSTNLPR